MLKYGFQRLALIGSAGYQRAELPLDDSVSLIAPNNHGKTSLINALQFLLIIDKRRMDFGSHTLEKSLRFYFPNNSAYILLEVILPQAGTVVFGCVGKGVGYDYEYFAYEGELNLDDYRFSDGNIVSQPKLISHLANKGHLAHRYNSKDFRHLIYGSMSKENRKKNNETDFTIFKLENLTDARSFQQVLTKTLRLDKLNSSDVKNYLLDIFSRELPSESIDVKKEWDKAFGDIELENKQYLAALNNLPLIQDLEHKFNQVCSLRGKILAYQPQINNLLHAWHDYLLLEKDALTKQKIEYKKTQEDMLKQHFVYGDKCRDLNNELSILQQIEEECEKLKTQFALIPDQFYLESQLKLAEQKYETQAALCIQSKRYSSSDLNRQLQERREQYQKLMLQQQTLENNLYLHISKLLNTSELEKLNKVFSQQVMQLSPEQYSFDINQFQTWLKTHSIEQFSFDGLTLSLDGLIPQHVQKTEQELALEIHSIEEQIKNLNELLEVSIQGDEAEKEKNKLNHAVKQCEKELSDYQHLQKLIDNQASRFEQKNVFEKTLEAIEAELATFNEKHEILTQQLNEIDEKIKKLDSDNTSIDKLKHQRIDDQILFMDLSKQTHAPYVLAANDWSLDLLPNRFEEYIIACKNLVRFSDGLRQIKNDLAQKGLTKFQMAQTQDEELANIIQFSHCLNNEKKALDRRARSAVVTVTASLRELRSGLLAFQSKMKEFNRLISHRQLSDLKTFKIEALEEDFLVDAISRLIREAELTESGQSFELFDQKSILEDDKITHAKNILIEEGKARNGLKVADLFKLEFIVAKQDQSKESFEDIDSAASNGTVLMAKLVTGLAMLHLMQDKRHSIKTVCYLDEALALDTKNQVNLIEIADQFGFALIFASPAPLTTAKYCVPIHQADGKNYISRHSWQIFELIKNREMTSVFSEPSL